MISKEERMKIILQNERWQAHVNYRGNEETGLCNHMSEFSKYAADLIQNGQFANLAGGF
ncbi:MAG: hypothetical protein ACETWR_01570 [Anaerolineae bacterium]